MFSFSLNGITGELAKSFAPGLRDMVADYMAKDAKVDNITWLGGQLAKHLPKLAPEGIAKIGEEMVGGVGAFQSRMASLQAAAAQGKAVSEWLRDYLEDNLPQGGLQRCGDYLEQVHGNLAFGNEIMRQAMADPNGMINITAEAQGVDVPASGEEWNSFTMLPLLDKLEQQTELMGMNGMGMPLGADFMQQAMAMPTGIVPPELMENDPPSGLDQGVKLAAAAALKVFVEKQKKGVLSKILPVRGIADIACWGVEGAKCIGRLALGKMSAMEALGHMKKCTAAALTGFIANGVAPKLLGMIPVVGMPLGVAVSALLASMSTEEIQQKLSQGINFVAGVAREVAQGIAETAKEAVNGVKNVVNGVKNAVMNFLGVEA